MQSRFFLAFDMDGDELISFHEYLLVLVFLGVHVEVRHRCSADHRPTASSLLTGLPIPLRPSQSPSSSQPKQPFRTYCRRHK